MPGFRYTAIDAAGGRVFGELEAADTDAARERLAANRFRIETLERIGPLPDAEASAKQLSEQEMADFMQHVSAIAARGLPLASGLRALAEELPSGSLRLVLSEISEKLDSGTSLEDSIRSQGSRLPAHLQGLVLSGVRSGRLGEVLEHHVKYLAIGVELKRQIAVALAYPTVLLIALCVLFVVISVWIVDDFNEIFADFGISLPIITEIVFVMSAFVIRTWPYALVGLVMGVPSAWWIAGRSFGPAARQRLMYRVPLIGPVLRWRSLADLSYLTGLLVESEMPLPTAFRLAGEGIRDPEIADACRGVIREIEAGQSLSESAVLRQRFTADLGQILSWGEGHEVLAESFRIAGEMFEGRARVQASFAIAVVTPLAFLIVVWGIGLLVISLFMPLVRLLNDLS